MPVRCPYKVAGAGEAWSGLPSTEENRHVKNVRALYIIRLSPFRGDLAILNQYQCDTASINQKNTTTSPLNHIQRHRPVRIIWNDDWGTSTRHFTANYCTVAAYHRPEKRRQIGREISTRGNQVHQRTITQYYCLKLSRHQHPFWQKSEVCALN